jgi:hypothetical protein
MGARAQYKSGYVALGMVGTLAFALTSCGSDEPDRRCVDGKTNRVVDERACEDGHGGARWYYGGGGGRKVGDTVSGGSFDKGAVSRNGFGGGGDGGRSGG